MWARGVASCLGMCGVSSYIGMCGVSSCIGAGGVASCIGMCGAGMGSVVADVVSTGVVLAVGIVDT